MSRWAFTDVLAARRKSMASPPPQVEQQPANFMDRVTQRRRSQQAFNQGAASNLAESKRDDAMASTSIPLVPGVAGGIASGIAGGAAPLVRPFSGAAADYLQAEGAAITEAHARNVAAGVETGEIGPVRQFFEENLPGVASSLTQMAALAPLGGVGGAAVKGVGAAGKAAVGAATKAAGRRGMAAMAGGFAASAGDQGYYQGRQAGLGKVDSAKHAAEQATAEAGFMLAGAALGKVVKGAGGIEEWFTSGKAPKFLSKQMLASGVGELTEENMTSIAQQVSTAKNIPGAENSANWTDEKGSFWNSPMMKVIEQTTKQTSLMLGLGNVAQRAAQYASGARDDESGMQAADAIAKVRTFVEKSTRRAFAALPEQFRLGVSKNRAAERTEVAERLGMALEQQPVETAVAEPVSEALPSESLPDRLPEALVESPSLVPSALSVEPEVARAPEMQRSVPDAGQASPVVEGVPEAAPPVAEGVGDTDPRLAAINEAFVQNRDRLVNVARIARTPPLPEADAEDVVQDTYAKILGGAFESFDPERGTPGNWLTSIVRHNATDLVNASNRRRKEERAASRLRREEEKAVAEEERARNPAIPERPFPVVYTDPNGVRLTGTQIGVDSKTGNIAINLDKGQGRAKSARDTVVVKPDALIERVADIEDAEVAAATEVGVPVEDFRNVYAETEARELAEWAKREKLRKVAKRMTGTNAEQIRRLVEGEQSGDYTNIPEFDTRARDFVNEEAGDSEFAGLPDDEILQAVFEFVGERPEPPPDRADMLADTVDRMLANQGEISDESGDASFDFGAPEPAPIEQSLRDKTGAWKIAAGEKRRAASQGLRDAFKDDPDMFDDPSVGLFSGPGFDPNKLDKMVAYAASVVEEGVATFADFVAVTASDLGEAAATKLRPYLEQAWTNLRETNPDLDDPSAEVAPVDVQPAEPVQPSVEPQSPAEPPQSPPVGPVLDADGEEVTSVKNAVTEVLRASVGLPELESPGEVSWESLVTGAQEEMEAEPLWIPNLVKNNTGNNAPTVLKDNEIAGLALYQQSLKSTLENQVVAMEVAGKADDLDAQLAARSEFDATLEELDLVTRAARGVGTEQGRALAARKMLIKEDLSLGRLLARRVADRGGRKMSAEESTAEQEKIIEQARQIEELIAERDERDSQKETRQKMKVIEDGIAVDVVEAKRAKKKAKRKARKADIQKKIDSAFADMRAAMGVARMNPLTPDVLGPAIRLAAAHVEMGILTFQEFMASVRTNMGGDVDEAVFRAAWQEQKDSGALSGPDAEDIAAKTKLAKQIQKSLIEAAVAEGNKKPDRETIVNSVHAGMQEWFEGTSLEETENALSGYGKYSPPTEDTVRKIIQDHVAQLTKVGQLKDLERGQAPKRTGQGRQVPSQEERILQQQVQEAMRAGEYEITDPETQLRTPQEARERAVDNRIKDLNWEIDNEMAIVREKTPLKETPELTDKIKERDRLQKIRDELLRMPRGPATEAQREAARARALDVAIKGVEADIAAGGKAPKAKPRAKATNAEIEAKEARLEELKAIRDEIQLLNNPKPSELEVKKAARKRRLHRSLAIWKERLATQDFTPKPKREEIPLDEEDMRIRKEIQDVIRQYEEDAHEARRKSWSAPVQAAEAVQQMMYASRAAITAADFSGLGRQGGFAAAAHPKLAAKAAAVMYKAMVSEGGEFRAAENISQRPNSKNGLYARAKLPITTNKARLQDQEEVFMGRYAKLIPLVSASERAYVAFLNELRANMFDSLVATMGRTGRVTDVEAKAIARFVGIATGRGDLGKFNGAAAGAAVVMFAPRYTASRFQLLAELPIALFTWRDPPRVRKMILKEYVRASAGTATFIGMYLAAAALLVDDDDDRWSLPSIGFDPDDPENYLVLRFKNEDMPSVMLDPRSSEWMKKKEGETRLDPLYGLSQTVVFGARLMTGQYRNAKGEIKSLRPADATSQFDLNYTKMLTNFVRTKAAPWPGTFWDWKTGENVVGETVTDESAAMSLITPLSVRDAAKLFKDQGIYSGIPKQILGLHGEGVQTYGPKSKDASIRVMGMEFGASPEEKEKTFASALRGAQYGDEPPEYLAARPAIDKRRWENVQKKKFASLVGSATMSPESPDGRERKAKAQERLKAHGNLEAAQAYLRTTRRSNWDAGQKKKYRLRHAALRRLFPDQGKKK